MEASLRYLVDPWQRGNLKEVKAPDSKRTAGESSSITEARQVLFEGGRASVEFAAHGHAFLGHTICSNTQVPFVNDGLGLAGLPGSTCPSSGPQDLQKGKGSGWEMQLNQEEVVLDGAVELPSIKTLMHAVQECRKHKVLSHARHVHAHIQNHGLEFHAAIGNYTVSMFVECGSVSDALQVFHRLARRNVHSWTSLMLGYVEIGQTQLVIELYHKMQEDSVHPSSYTHVALLKACTKMKEKGRGQEIHVETAQIGNEGNLFVGNALVHMYAKCGSLAEAHSVFDQMLFRDIVSWNTLIAGYAEHGPGLEALKCFQQMQVEGVGPDTVSFISSLKACCSIGAVDKTREVHMDIARRGLERDVVVGSTLVDTYAKCGSLAEAQEVFDKMTTRDAVLWNALITGYAEHRPDQEVLQLLHQMQLEGISPDAVTVICSLKACSNMGVIERGRQLHAEIAGKGFERDRAVGNTLVAMYASCGSLAEAGDVLNRLHVKDVVAWSAMIAGYAENGYGSKALKCLEEMRMEGIAPNDVTFICSLKACSNLEAADKGRELHIESTQIGLERDPVVGITLVDMYAKCGLLSEAQYVSDRLPVQDVVSQTALIAGYAEHGPFQEALKYHEQMKLEGVSPNGFTFSCMAKACSNMGALHKGHEIHMEVLKQGFEKDLFVGNALVDMYGRCGSLFESQVVFNELPVQDVVGWSALIKGFGMNHEGNLALDYFLDMQEQGVKPDAATLSCLLAACSRASLVHDGQEFFKVMRNEYGVTPTIDHYTCMIDLLARAGYLYEAEKFLEFMPYPPDEETWTALLSACKTYGEAELGLKCFQQLVSLNPKSSVSYLFMGNIYASVGRLDDSFRIEELRKHAGAKKKPASALIEVNKRVHEFTVGSNQNEEITAMLDSLQIHLKKEGYVSNLNVVSKCIPDEEKEASLCEHAERVAIAFGLLNTPQGQTLRVTKNLRMCDDCHSTMKVISKMEKREIIVRDAYCVHRFKESSCSCGDRT